MYSYEEVYLNTLKYFNGDDLATNVFITKYALKNNENAFLEKTPDDMHKRIAKEFARIEHKYGGSGALDEKTIYDYLKDFKYICPQGSPMYGIGNNFQNVSLSNCNVIRPPEDSMSSIFNTARDMANLYKRRYGVGTDLSNLRPCGASVTNAAKTSTGAYSFADLYSYVTRMVGQSGRRGALLLSMDVRHPDIENFITMKQDLTKVTGANISVKLCESFMIAVQNDSDFELRWPIEGKSKITKNIKARDLWNKIVSSATKTAEPGLLFWDTILKYLPAECYSDLGFKHYSTNPCGELPLSEDSCRLVSQNLKHLVKNPFTKKAYFDFDKWSEVISIGQRLSDDLVDLEIEKLDNLINISDSNDEKDLFTRLKKSCENGRRTGLGTHGLADALACLGIVYGDAKSLEIVEQIYETLKVVSYKTSVELAKERGAFPIWDWEIEKDNAFIAGLPNWLLRDIKKHGRRNISNLTNAPTGSVSILCQTSSGLEPVFKNSYVRRKKINPGDNTETYDFMDDSGDKWKEFKVFHNNVAEWMKLNPNKKLPEYFIESDKVDWQKRVEVQSIMTRHIDHSISSTINLPAGTSTDIVGQIYMEAWKKGLKGVTVYVDGSRTGVLVSKEKKSCTCSDRNAPKRPEKLECNIHHVSVKGQKWLILVGLYEGRPYEVFGGVEENIEIPKKYSAGVIVKVKERADKNRYDLCFGEDGCIKDIAKMFDNTNYQTHTRLISLGLRHGAKVNFVVEQLLRDPDNDLTSFSRAISRVLKKYIEDGTKVTSDKTCSNCNQETLIYQDGCVLCSSCGYSKCS